LSGLCCYCAFFSFHCLLCALSTYPESGNRTAADSGQQKR
jgi:hypothetical protein